MKKKKETEEDRRWKEHCKKVRELKKEYPHIPSAIFDIEASPEMAMMYEDMM